MASVHQISEDLLEFAQPIYELQLDPENLNTHDTRSIESIMVSLQKFGQQKPIVCTQDGVVKAGNGTLEAARRLGWTHIAATLFTGGGDLEALAYAIADNQTSDLSEWDDPALLRTLTRYAEEDLGVTPEELGFDERDLQAIRERAEAMLRTSEGGEDDDWDAPNAGGGDSGSGSGDGSPDAPEERITYTMQFDSERQLAIWQGFLKLLKKQYPEFSTPHARLLAYIREAGAIKR